MNNDLNGTSGAYRISPSPNEATTHLTENKTVSSSLVDLRPYDSMETMSNGAVAFIPQQFFHRQLYEADAQNPLLLQPDPEGETGPQPYGAAEQKLIMKFFDKRVKELLTKSSLSAEETQTVYQALISNTPLTQPKLAQLAKNLNQQAKADTREQTHLPESWDPHSHSAQDWEPSLPAPYHETKRAQINQSYDQATQEALEQFIEQAHPSLSTSHIELLKKALATGKVSSAIAEDFMMITKKATETTQKTYGLSETWFKGTSNPNDWRPIHVGIVTPAAVNQARSELILENISQLLVGYEKAGEKVTNQFDAAGSHGITMDEFRRTISKAIQNLKAVLREIQLGNLDDSDKTLAFKLDKIKVRQEEFNEQIEKQKEADKKKAKAEKVSLGMKIAGPIIAALAIIVGGVLSVFGGVGVPLIVAGIAIGLAMMTYSIVDGQTGCTAKLMSLINEAIANICPDNEFAQKLIKALLIAVVVAVLAVIIIATAGGAAANIASSIATQVVKEVVKQLAIQTLIIAIMASNVIPELVGAILQKAADSGLIKLDEKTKQILETITMVITMVVMMVAMAITGGKGAAAAKGAQGADIAAKEATLAARQAQTAMQRVQEMTKAFATKLASIPGKIGETAKEILEGIKEFGRGYSTKIADFFRARSELNQLSALKQTVGKLNPGQLARAEELSRIMNDSKMGALNSTYKTLQLTPMAINIADGINRGVLGLQVVKLLEEVGDHKEAIELLQGLIKMLEKLLTSLQTGIDKQSEDILNLQQAFNRFYAGLSQNTNKIFQTLQA